MDFQYSQLLILHPLRATELKSLKEENYPIVGQATNYGELRRLIENFLNKREEVPTASIGTYSKN